MVVTLRRELRAVKLSESHRLPRLDEFNYATLRRAQTATSSL